MTGITILLPTHNRGEILRETLESMTAVDRSGIDLSLVVIDNNSSDGTRRVVAAFEGRLPVEYLHEARPGKNCALNAAIRRGALREIVVFTDDDVTPRSDWLQQVVAAARRWPDVPTFGGRVEVGWPGGHEPVWTTIPWIMAMGFSWHHLGDAEVFYERPQCPFGPNFWVRREVFSVTGAFDETLGPRPTNRLMGGETAFLRALQEQGCRALHVPQAMVCHRIQAAECSVETLRRRAFRFGRGQARLHGMKRPAVYQRSHLAWWVLTLLDEVYTSLGYASGRLRRDELDNGVRTIEAMIRFGVLRESIAMARERRD